MVLKFDIPKVEKPVLWVDLVGFDEAGKVGHRY
jgi:hypothetical protein